MNYEIPASVQAAARRGLELRKEYGRGGTSIGLQTARRLAQGGKAPFSFLRRVSLYFPRHQGDRLTLDGRGGREVSNGYIAWLLWGGDPGRRWSEGIMKKLTRSRKAAPRKMARKAAVRKTTRRRTKRNPYAIPVSVRAVQSLTSRGGVFPISSYQEARNRAAEVEDQTGNIHSVFTSGGKYGYAPSSVLMRTPNPEGSFVGLENQSGHSLGLVEANSLWLNRRGAVYAVFQTPSGNTVRKSLGHPHEYGGTIQRAIQGASVGSSSNPFTSGRIVERVTVKTDGPYTSRLVGAKTGQRLWAGGQPDTERLGAEINTVVERLESGDYQLVETTKDSQGMYGISPWHVMRGQRSYGGAATPMDAVIIAAKTLLGWSVRNPEGGEGEGPRMRRFHYNSRTEAAQFKRYLASQGFKTSAIEGGKGTGYGVLKTSGSWWFESDVSPEEEVVAFALMQKAPANHLEWLSRQYPEAYVRLTGGERQSNPEGGEGEGMEEQYYVRVYRDTSAGPIQLQAPGGKEVSLKDWYAVEGVGPRGSFKVKIHGYQEAVRDAYQTQSNWKARGYQMEVYDETEGGGGSRMVNPVGFVRRVQVWSSEDGKWYPEKTHNVNSLEDAKRMADTYQSEGYAATVVNLRDDRLEYVVGMSSEEARRIVSGSRPGYRVNPSGGDLAEHFGGWTLVYQGPYDTYVYSQLERTGFTIKSEGGHPNGKIYTHADQAREAGQYVRTAVREAQSGRQSNPTVSGEGQGAYVVRSTGDFKKVKNLGWIIKNWRNIDHLRWESTNKWSGIFRAEMKDGTTYTTPYASFDVFKTFINRPVFKGLPLYVNGKRVTVGDADFKALSRERNPSSMRVFSMSEIRQLPWYTGTFAKLPIARKRGQEWSKKYGSELEVVLVQDSRGKKVAYTLARVSDLQALGGMTGSGEVEGVENPVYSQEDLDTARITLRGALSSGKVSPDKVFRQYERSWSDLKHQRLMPDAMERETALNQIRREELNRIGYRIPLRYVVLTAEGRLRLLVDPQDHKSKEYVESLPRVGTTIEGWPEYQMPAQTTSGRRRNPESQAAEFYETFHGEPSKEEVVITTEIHTHDHLTALGRLQEIKVKTLTGRELVMNWKGDGDDVPYLSSSEDGRQLFIEGGNQTIDLAKIGMAGKEWLRDSMVIGELVEVTYRTRKQFHQFKLTDYYHKLGEETKVKPSLIYDSRSGLMSIAGGQYNVEDRGIVN